MRWNRVEVGLSVGQWQVRVVLFQEVVVYGMVVGCEALGASIGKDGFHNGSKKHGFHGVAIYKREMNIAKGYALQDGFAGDDKVEDNFVG